MVVWLAWVCGALGLAVALLAGAATLRGRRVDDAQLVGAGVLELALLAQAVTAAVLYLRGPHGVSAVLFGGYLLTSVLVAPLGAFWAVGERTRWGTGVLAVAGVTAAVLVVRLEQIWRTGG